jgi:tRNA 2-selenouridine synthase
VFPGRTALAAWRALADAGDLEALAADLVGNHYDPAYDRSNRKDPRPRLATLEMAELADADQDAAADAIVGLLAQSRASSGASAAQSRSAPAGKS